MNTNLAAFLTLIRTGEGTLGQDGYRTMYGGSKFESYDDHPRKIIKAGAYSSSAAGAYQILQKTWDGLVKANPWALSDFTPEKQDAAAILLIKGRKAYDAVIDGRFKEAIILCNKEWASLPGSPYGQPTLSFDKAFKILADAGAVFAPEQPKVEAKPIKKEGEPVAPFLLAAIPSLIAALPDFAKMFAKDNPNSVPERNVEAVIKASEIIMQATGATNVQDAVEKIEASPEVAKQANEALRLSKADIDDILERENARQQANIKSAREFNSTERTIIGRFKFVHILSFVFVVLGGSAAIYVLATSADAAERAMSLQTLLIVGFAGVANFWLGSSSGSERKTELLNKND